MKQKMLDLGIEENLVDEVLKLYAPLQEELDKYKPKEKSQTEIELEARIKAIEEKEKEIERKEREATFKSDAKKKGIPEQLLQFIGNDADLDLLSSTMKELQLSSSFQPTVPRSEPSGITKEQFKAMGYTERMQLFETNKALYDKLSE